jgi:tetratricopeptide (TPR) repeat protein
MGRAPTRNLSAAAEFPGKEIALMDFTVLRMKFHAAPSLLLAGHLLAGCALAGCALAGCALAGCALAGCAYVKHVPPGQSLNEALAKKAELVSLPSPTPGPLTASVAVEPQPLPPGAGGPMPETEKVADSFTLGNLCMQQGHYAEAIAAYEAAVKADPNFADAWNNLAIAYQNVGQDEKAMAAFRKYKMVAMH